MTEGINNNLGTPEPVGGSVDAAKTRRETRRALLKAAALAMPLIVTLRGKPAHAQEASLGSLGITYGPMSYVTPADVSGGIHESYLWDAKDENGDVLKDKTRRSDAIVADPSVPKSP